KQKKALRPLLSQIHSIPSILSYFSSSSKSLSQCSSSSDIPRRFRFTYYFHSIRKNEENPISVKLNLPQLTTVTFLFTGGLRRRPKCPVTGKKIQGSLKIGVKVPKVSKSKKISWSKIRCPRQINSIDCGYFVMRFMKEVIVQNEIMIPVNYFPDHKCHTYSMDKLTEIKEDWATYMVDDIFGKQEAVILPS
ncbi:uncharacterized protein LOC131597820, partial [Vicia villosa]|uniref:uncharacterized protein LOC131597820 n=1 Tax=Vicia villosa TaxID=3911 RepID=UPI00273C4065